MTSGPQLIPSAAYRRLAAALEAEQPLLIAEIEAAIRGGIPEHAGARHPEDHDPSFSESVRRLVALVLDVITSGGELSDEQRSVVVHVAAERASAGSSLGAATDALHVAVGVGRDHALRLWPGVADDPRDLSGLGALLSVLSDVEHDLTRTFEAVFRDTWDEGSRAREALLRSLLERHFDARLATRARQLDLDLRSPLGVVLVVDTAEYPEPTFPDRLNECARALPGVVHGAVPYEARPEHPEFGVLVVPGWGSPPISADVGVVAEACKRFESVGVLGVANAPGSVRTVFEQLRPLASIALHASAQLGDAFHFDEALTFQLAAGLHPAAQTALVRRMLGRLMVPANASHVQGQIEALEAYYGETTVQAAATRTHLGSDDALRARLRRVTDLSGLDYRTERLHFEVAIALYRLRQSDWAPPGDPWWGDDGD